MENNKKIPLILAISTTTLASICALINLGVTLFCTKNSINHNFLVINSLLIFLFTTCLEITVLIKKGKIRNIIFSITSLLITLFVTFNILCNLNIIKIKTLATLQSFYNTNINDALAWGNKNNIKINQTYEYSDTIKEFNIISQDIAAGTLLKDVKEISLLVSNGPNPDKTFILQSLVGMNIDDAIAIINNNYMKNIEINYEINDTYDRDVIINQNINGEIKRNDHLILTVSLGKQEDLNPVELIDFKGKTLFEATLWLKRNGFGFEFNYEFSNEFNKDICIGQNEQAGTTLDPKEVKITLIVSKGKEITIPDFTTMTVTEATSWITDNKLKVTFKEKYDNELPEGSIIESSLAINTAAQEGETIVLTISKGRLKMEQFDSINAFRAWAESLGLEYEENSEFSNQEIGTIISTKPATGEFINLNDKLYVTYSKGKSTTIPNFYNKSKGDAESLCYNYSLRCYYSYRYSSSIASGNIISQSMSTGSEVAQNTSITLYVSSGPEPTKAPTPAPVVCDKSITETVYLSTGNTGEQTKSILTRSYPQIKWNFNMVDKCENNGNTSSGTICNASTYDGKVLNHCDTITLTIVK